MNIKTGPESIETQQMLRQCSFSTHSQQKQNNKDRLHSRFAVQQAIVWNLDLTALLTKYITTGFPLKNGT